MRRNQHNTTPLPRDELHRLYVVEGLSCKRIAPIFGVSIPTVHRSLQRYGIPVRNRSEARRQAVPVKYEGKSLETKRRVAAEMRARLTPESHRKQGEKMRGRTPPNKGVPWTPEQRAKMDALWQDEERRRQFSESRRGELSPNWRGGSKSELNRHLDTAAWDRARKACYERDGWICQDCGLPTMNFRDSRKNPKRRIQAHHIVRRRDGGTDDLSNLVTLCMSCHHIRERKYSEALFA